MALGFGSKKADGDAVSPSVDNNSPEKSNFGGENYYNGFTGDAEKQGSNGPRKMSRIGGPVTKSISGNMVDGRRGSSEDEADITIGKQMELEAGNAIQYRTCSWQKV